MKVAIVSDAIMPYHTGGKEQRIAQVSVRLAQAGHDVHLYTMKWWDGPKVIERNGIHLHGIGKKRALYIGDKRSMKQGVMFGFNCLRMIREDFDVADVDHMPYFPIFSMWLICKLKRRAFVATWHEVWGLAYWKQYMGAAGIVAYAIERSAALLPDKFIAVSPLTRQRIQEEYNVPESKVILAPNGIDTSIITSVDKPSRITSDVIYAGRLIKHKNVDMLLRAVDKVRAELPKIRCVIVGDGPEKVRLEKLAKQLNLGKNVTFVPFQEHHTDVLALMKASKVFVSASAREGFGIVAIEANACGLPVLTLEHPDNATTHLIEPGVNGRIFKDVTTLASELTETLQTEYDREALAARAEQYNWDHTTTSVLEGYAA